MKSSISPKKWNRISNEKKSEILYRSQRDIDNFTKIVKPIMEEVRIKGDVAIAKYTKKFQNAVIPPAKIRVSEKEFKHAESSLENEVKESIQHAIRNVESYHNKETIYRDNVISEVRKGVFSGKRVTPIESVGIYIPEEKRNFSSMVYMLAVPARIAKVPRRVMIIPPNKDGSVDAACLYAAKLSGIHEVYKVGGAQGIAALAYGTKRIAPVVKITGQGSAFVDAAKRYVSNVVHIGLPIGPSESVIISDGSTPARFVAYDMCIEAEHGIDTMSLVLTHKAEYASQICDNVNKILDQTPDPPKSIVQKVFEKYPPVIIAESEEMVMNICNTIAPEHLMIHSKSPSFIVADIRNAGEILMGEYSQFSLANYMAGSSAVLPSGGMSKTYSRVSVSDFLKKTSIINISKEGHTALSPYVQKLAQYEGLYFHSQALETRTK